jgi:hypothetical protein
LIIVESLATSIFVIEVGKEIFAGIGNVCVLGSAVALAFRSNE